MDWSASSTVAKPPEQFDLTDQPEQKKARRAQTEADDDWNDWAQSVAATFGEEDSNAPVGLAELLELDEVCESVKWPPGWSAQAARQAVRERPPCVAPERKRARPNEEDSARKH